MNLDRILAFFFGCSLIGAALFVIVVLADPERASQLMGNSRSISGYSHQMLAEGMLETSLNGQVGLVCAKIFNPVWSRTSPPDRLFFHTFVFV